MYQFTTPTITIKLPESVSVDNLDALAVVVQQDDNKLVLDLSQVATETATNSIQFTLSQLETGGFKPGTVNIQCHILVGDTAYATQIMKANIYRNIHGEVIA